MHLVQVAQRVSDLARATAFYTSLLGRPPTATFDPPGLVFFTLGDVRLLLGRDAAGGYLYLGVDDLDATLARLRAAGVSVVGEPHPVFSHTDDVLGPAGSTEWQAFIEDSEGNVVGLVEHRRPGDAGR